MIYIRILFVGKFIEPPFSEGIINTVLNWARAIDYAGVEIRVLSTSSTCSGSFKLFDIEFEYLNIGKKRYNMNLLNHYSFQKYIKNIYKHYDLIHFASSADSLLYLPLLKLMKYNSYKTVNTYHKNKIGGHHSFDAITVTSRRVYNKVIREKNKNIKKMDVIYPCVDTNFFKKRNKIKIREKIGIEEDLFVILALGHFQKGRGFTQLIEVLNEINNKKVKTKLILGWSGQGENDYINKILQLSKKYNIKILEPTRNINLYYNAADVYVLCTSPRNVIEFPLSVIEALSSGTPVISFNINAIPEIIVNDLNGCLIEYGNFKELKDKIVFLMDDHSYLGGLSDYARKTATEKFSYDVIGRQWSNLYKDLT